jgi:Putative transposase of IS4/5 family (DUF4096)
MSRKSCPSDLSDAEWEKIKPLLPAPNTIASPRTVDLQEVLNAIFYRVDNGGFCCIALRELKLPHSKSTPAECGL